jgi:Lrp/AsnC family transcriptional regulator for asnA, asnC and gidA
MAAAMKAAEPAPPDEAVLSRRNGVAMLQKAPELTDLDRRIIHALQLDGRVSYATLGPKLGTTEKVVRLRAQALLDAGVIDITVVTDPQALGYRYVSMVGLRVVGGGRESVVDQLTALPNVDYIVTAVGRYDILVEVLSASLGELGDLVDRNIATLDGVSTVDIYPYLSLFHQQGVFAGGDRQLGVTQRTDDFQIDDTDAAIVQLLNQDGRMPFQHIGRELGISGDMVRRRVARMRQNGAVRIMAITNPMTLGFDLVALVGLVLGPGARAADVAGSLADMAAVSYVAICTGGFDLFIEVACQTTVELQQLMDELRAVAGIIRMEPFLYLELKYRRISPPVKHQPPA